MTPRRPAVVCRAPLAALDASEVRRSRRKRDTTPDAIGMSLKRQLLDAVQAMARDVLAEWRLAAGAPSEDRS